MRAGFRRLLGFSGCGALVAAAAAFAFPQSASARPLASIKERGSIILCANPSYLPFSSRSGDHHGLEIDLGQALAKELGVGLEIGWVIFPYQVGRVDCDVIFDSIVDPQTEKANHIRLSKPYNVSGVAIAVRPGIEGVNGYGDLKKGQRVGAMVGSLASMILGEKGLPTIPFAFEDEMIESLGKGELDAALVTPSTIGYYNITHKDAPLKLVRAYEDTPELRWSIAIGMRKADDALVAAVNDALDRLLAEGAVQRIYAEYGVDQRLPQP